MSTKRVGRQASAGAGPGEHAHARAWQRTARTDDVEQPVNTLIICRRAQREGTTAVSCSISIATRLQMVKACLATEVENLRACHESFMIATVNTPPLFLSPHV